MTLLLAALAFIARQGRLVLIAALVAGIALPGLAAIVRPHIPEIVAVMLFLAALRIGPAAAVGGLAEAKVTLALVGVYQLALPCFVAVALALAGFSGPVATALVLMCAASPISGAPNLTLMTRNDPAPALRLLVAGTAALPLTVLPVFALWPAFGDVGTVVSAALRLLALIGGATCVAFTIRHLVLPRPGPAAIAALDGASALMMAIAVLGLMAAIGPALRDDPGRVALTLALAIIANYGLQLASFSALAALGRPSGSAGLAISAGNRNMMIFLTTLPPEITDPLLLFLACYQVPMYLTPVLLGPLYAPRRPPTR